MAERSLLVASAGQETALRALAASSVRGEADRARAVLLTLSGWTAAEIGEAFGTTEDSVRRWRHWFAQGGVDAPRSTLAPGASPARGERALACAREVLAAPVQDRTNWSLPRLRAEIGTWWSAWACACNCAAPRPRQATWCCYSATRARR